MRNLEQSLETILLIRDRSGLQLTAAGSKMFQYCQIQTQLEDEFISELKSPKGQGLHGFLKIGGASTLLWSVLTPALAPLLRKNPAIHLEMAAREASDLPRLLQNGQVNLILTCGKVENPHFESHEVGVERNVMVAAKNYSGPAALFLDHDESDRMTFNYLKFQGHSSKKIERLFMDDIHGILAGVEAGLGRAVIPRHLLKGKNTLQIAKGEKEFTQPVFLHYLKQPFYSKLHLATISTIRTNLPSHLI